MSLFDGNLVEERMSGSADEEETCKDVLIMSRLVIGPRADDHCCTHVHVHTISY